MLLKVRDAAELAGVSTVRIYAAIKQGLLTPVPEVPYVCLREEDVLQFKTRVRAKGGRPPKPRRPRGRPKKSTSTAGQE